MAIYEYHASDGYGFQGLRVAVYVDGQPVQAYFSFLDEGGQPLNARDKARVRQQASAREAQWLELQAVSRSARLLGDTGVRGISANLKRESRRLVDGTVSVRYRAVFRVAAVGRYGLRTATFSIHRRGYRNAWREAVACLLDVQGRRGHPARNAACPDPVIFEQVRQAKRARGESVPANVVPDLD